MQVAAKIAGCWSFGLILTVCFAVMATAEMPPNTNRLETGGQYDIKPPPTNMMFKITNNETNAGDDNLVWSHSGRMLAIDRSDPNVTGQGGNKYICLLDVRNLGNIQVLGARSSASNNPGPVYANITDWTWNDDRVLFGWQPEAIPLPPKRLMSCTANGPVSVATFLADDAQVNPSDVFAPSVIYDPTVSKERLLFLVSSIQGMPGATATLVEPRCNLYTATFDHGGVPNWADRVQLTAFGANWSVNTNLFISSAKWCPELGTNYQPICNRLVMLLTGGMGQDEQTQIIVLNDVQGIIADPTTAPTNLLDPRFVVVETNCSQGSQVSWTYDGQYVMYGRMSPGSTDLYSMRADSSTNTAVKFEVPASLASGSKQWLCISPDGMKAAFTVDHKAYVIPLQFDNIAVTGAVVTNVLTDASYTAVDVSGDAIPSNTIFSIVAPPSVDTNNFNGEFSGYAREFSVSGVSSQFDLLTNAQMTLHFSEADIPSGASVTNLAIYVYNPQGTNAGQTGTWDKLDSVINTNLLTISAEIQHFSIYAIGRVSAQPEHVSVIGDYDGDGKTDLAVYNAGYWSIYSLVNGLILINGGAWGGSDSITVPGDYDGDGKSDLAVYNAGYWSIYSLLNGLILINGGAWGGADSITVPGDYDGDGKFDLAVYRNGYWSIFSLDNGIILANAGEWGGADWTPVPGDYDGDGKSDLAVYRNGYWSIYSIANGLILANAGEWGGADCVPVPGDYDGDGKADLAFYRNGYWSIYSLANGLILANAGEWGGADCVPVPGDFDGDGKADLAFYRNGYWSIYSLANGLILNNAGEWGGADWEPVK
ncbi:MAG: VCBS repeat-containing protein [Verrucomicrobiota bacterium]